MVTKVKTSKEAPWAGLTAASPEVQACPRHRFVTLLMGDAVEFTGQPNRKVRVCARCYSQGCLAQGPDGEDDFCRLPKHHKEHHRFESGWSEPVGGWPPPGTREPVMMS